MVIATLIIQCGVPPEKPYVIMEKDIFNLLSKITVSDVEKSLK